jgi:hypothetical protein
VSHGAGAVLRENDNRRGRARRRDAAKRTSTAVGSKSRRLLPVCLQQARARSSQHPEKFILGREGEIESGAVESYKQRNDDDVDVLTTTTTMVDQSLVDDNNNNNNNINHPGRRPQVSIDLQIGNHLRSAHPSPINADQVVLVPSLFGSDLSATTFHELREELVPLLRVKYRHRSDQNKSKRKGGGGICSNNKNDDEEDDGTASGWLLNLARTEGGGILVAPKSLGAAALARIILGGPKESAAPSRTITATTGGKRPGGDADAAAAVIDAVLFKTDGDDDDEDDDEDDEEEGVVCAKENAHAANPRPVLPPSSSSSSSLQCRAVAEVVQRLCQYYSIDPHTALVNVGIFVGRPRTHHVKARPAQSYVPVRRCCSWAVGRLLLCFPRI